MFFPPFLLTFWIMLSNFCYSIFFIDLLETENKNSRIMYTVTVASDWWNKKTVRRKICSLIKTKNDARFPWQKALKRATNCSQSTFRTRVRITRPGSVSVQKQKITLTFKVLGTSTAQANKFASSYCRLHTTALFENHWIDMLFSLSSCQRCRLQSTDLR